jgi:hypothetical protein
MTKYQTYRNLSRFHWYPARVDGIDWELFVLHKDYNRWLSKRHRVFFLNNGINSTPGLLQFAKPNVIRPSKYTDSLLLCDHINKRSKYTVEVDETWTPINPVELGKPSSLYKHLEIDLANWDLVEFGRLIYKVCDTHLSNMQWWNEAIFELLWVDKKKMATEAYGYPSGGGDRPVSKAYDYSALSRLVDNLIDFIINHPDTWSKLQ